MSYQNGVFQFTVCRLTAYEVAADNKEKGNLLLGDLNRLHWAFTFVWEPLGVMQVKKVEDHWFKSVYVTVIVLGRGLK